MSDNRSLNIRKCRREKTGELFCRCRYRKIPRTCPYLHENESIEQYHGRMKNDSNYGNFDTAKQQWESWSEETNSSDKKSYTGYNKGKYWDRSYLNRIGYRQQDDTTSEEQDGEFYAYVNHDNKNDF